GFSTTPTARARWNRRARNRGTLNQFNGWDGHGPLGWPTAFATRLAGPGPSLPSRLRIPRMESLRSCGKIESGMGQRHQAGVWRPYTGSNQHAHHVHVSVRHGAEFFDADASWGWASQSENS